MQRRKLVVFRMVLAGLLGAWALFIAIIAPFDEETSTLEKIIVPIVAVAVAALILAGARAVWRARAAAKDRRGGETALLVGSAVAGFVTFWSIVSPAVALAALVAAWFDREPPRAVPPA